MEGDLRLALRKAMLAFGATAEDVRILALADGARGVRRDSRNCLLARMLGRRLKLGAGQVVSVDGGSAAIVDMAAELVYRQTPLTDACTRAVRYFDAGDWPELVEEAAP